MTSKSPFKWRHFLPEIILWGVRWYCSYPISYRQLEEMMCDHGVEVDHSTLSRWVQKYAPELDKRCRPHLKPTSDSWRVDETYIKVKGEDRYRLFINRQTGCRGSETFFPQGEAGDSYSRTKSD